MASRSLGELLLRPSSFTRIPHTTTTQRLRWITTTPPQSAQPQRKQTDDPFSLFPEETRETAPRRTQLFNRRPSQTSQSETSQEIDSLVRDLPRSQPSDAPHPSDEMRAARSNHAFGTEFSRLGRGRAARGAPKLQFDDMDMPDELVNPALANKTSASASLAIQQEETFSNFPRLNPAYGRTVDLDPARGRDIVRGLSMLGSLTARNKIRQDFNKQRFHERPGLKRKRLVSTRWRARFKIGFRELTGRVTELTRKGW